MAANIDLTQAIGVLAIPAMGGIRVDVPSDWSAARLCCLEPGYALLRRGLCVGSAHQYKELSLDIWIQNLVGRDPSGRDNFETARIEGCHRCKARPRVQRGSIVSAGGE